MSLCGECDAPPGECEHDAYRYFDAEPYVRIPGVGWVAPTYRTHGDVKLETGRDPFRHKPARLPDMEARPLPRLVGELEAWVLLDPPLEIELRQAYERDPLGVTRLCASVIGKAERRELRSPAGLLYSRLRELLHGP
jgi:hypothetical protein